MGKIECFEYVLRVTPNFIRAEPMDANTKAPHIQSGVCSHWFDFAKDISAPLRSKPDSDFIIEGEDKIYVGVLLVLNMPTMNIYIVPMRHKGEGSGQETIQNIVFTYEHTSYRTCPGDAP